MKFLPLMLALLVATACGSTPVQTSHEAPPSGRSPQDGQYLSLSGPPGGTLMFVVEGYRDAEASTATVERLFARWAGHGARPDPVVKGSAQTVIIAGAGRPAMAFVVGRSMATTNWCVTLVPSREHEGEGLLVLMGVGVREGASPDCAASTSEDHIRPLVASFALW
jgi:hypothetical protein